MFTRLLIAAYLIESGLLLVIAPWTVWWERNLFARMAPSIAALMSGPALRVVVGVVGAVTVVGGLSDLRVALFAPRAAAPDDAPPPQP